MFVSRRLLDLKKKVATFEPLVNYLFAENETLKNKVAILTTKAENDKERVATLEKNLGAKTVDSWGHGGTRLQRL